jgi:hypothetical protein
MFRAKKGTISFNIIIILISVWLIQAFPAEAQLTNITFTPIVPSYRYGELWNPLFNTFDTTFTPFSFNSFGLGFPFFNLNPIENQVFSDSLNFLFRPVTPSVSILDSLTISGSLPFFQLPFGGLNTGFVMPNLTPTTIASLATPLPMRMAAQAGTWIGTWQSTFIAFIILFNSGTMNMTLIEDLTLNTLDGTAILVGSRFTDTLFNVRGVLTDPTNFILEGVVATGIALVLNCTLTSPTTMTGSYTVSSGFGGQLLDTGVFNLTLV